MGCVRAERRQDRLLYGSLNFTNEFLISVPRSRVSRGFFGESSMHCFTLYG